MGGASVEYGRGLLNLLVPLPYTGPGGSASSYERPIKKERPGTPKAAAPAVSAACLMVDMSVGIRWRVVSMVDNHSLY